MNILFYMPFKPLGHRNPSGDLIIGSELHDFFVKNGQSVKTASRLRCRWLYLKPWQYPQLARERRAVVQLARQTAAPDIWFSYHSYYKAPDLLGPFCSARLSIPYVLFQGIYSTSRKRNLVTLPGFLLNRAALRAAAMVFTNKKNDEVNLKRLLPAERVTFIPPGLCPDQFTFEPAARHSLREQWAVGGRRVVLTAAMFRPGVKTSGIKTVIDTCAQLLGRGHALTLVVLGDGSERSLLEREGKQKLGEHIIFTGKIMRRDLRRYYSAADIFAFPGVQESLGMVYLEAQSVGLPVVAFRDWGAQEAVVHQRTGLLAPYSQPGRFKEYLEYLLLRTDERLAMGQTAREHIRAHHDLSANYRLLLSIMQDIVARRHGRAAEPAC